MLGGARVGAHGEPDVVGVAGEAREDLLSVDHVRVALAHGAGRERREIGAGSGLRIPDAEVERALEDARQEEALLLVRSEAHQARRHGVDREHRHGRAAAHRLVEEDELLDRTAALAAEFPGPADAEPAVASHAPHHRAHGRARAHAAVQLLPDLGREQLGVVGPKLAAQRLMLRGVGDVHGFLSDLS